MTGGFNHLGDVILPDNGRDFLEWSSQLDSNSQQEYFNQRSFPEIGKWFLDSEIFKWWETTPSASSKVLWCYGNPGVGKSFLVSTVIRHFQQRNDQTIGLAWIYCKHDPTPSDLIGALLKQLVYRRKSRLPEESRRLYMYERRDPGQDNLDELRSELKYFSQVFIFIDGLSEIGKHLRLLDDLVRVLESSNGNAHILVTSQSLFLTPGNKLEANYWQLSEEDPNVQNDVRVYARSRLELGDMSGTRWCAISKNEILSTDLVHEIANKAQGRLLIAELHMDSLSKKLSARSILDAATDFPDTLDKRYKEAVKNMRAGPKELKPICENALMWLSCALRPLTISELQHALSIQQGDTKVDNLTHPFMNKLVGACHGLVIVDPKNDQIRLFHQTTYEYFKNDPIVEDGHELMSESCLKYLLLGNFKTGCCKSDEDMNSRLNSHPLLEYAAKEWGNHARMSSNFSKTFQKLSSNLFRSSSNLACSNQAKNIPTHRGPGYSQQFTKNVTGLQVAASFGLKDVVQYLINKNDNVTCTDDDGRTAAHNAAESGSVQIMELLEKAGAKLDATDTNRTTVLHIASWHGHYSLCQKLLSQISVHVKDKNGFTPLHYAASQGHKEVADLLVGHNANVETMTDQEKYWTSLHVAATKGHDIRIPGRIRLPQQQSSLDKLFGAGRSTSLL